MLVLPVQHAHETNRVAGALKQATRTPPRAEQQMMGLARLARTHWQQVLRVRAPALQNQEEAVCLHFLQDAEASRVSCSAGLPQEHVQAWDDVRWATMDSLLERCDAAEHRPSVNGRLGGC